MRLLRAEQGRYRHTLENWIDTGLDNNESVSDASGSGGVGPPA